MNLQVQVHTALSTAELWYWVLSSRSPRNTPSSIQDLCQSSQTRTGMKQPLKRQVRSAPSREESREQLLLRKFSQPLTGRANTRPGKVKQLHCWAGENRLITGVPFRHSPGKWKDTWLQEQHQNTFIFCILH